jgi:hypothetical protein
MSRATCDGCGKDCHICLEIDTDGAVHGFLGALNFCETCGSFLAGVIEAVRRSVFKHTSSG